jgi:hypothetical protein
MPREYKQSSARVSNAVVFCLLVVAGGSAQDFVPHVSGEVALGHDYGREIGSGLLFLLTATGSGWKIGIVPKAPCSEDGDWASVVNAPYRSYNSLHLDTEYGVTAKEAVDFNPREFSFVTTCADYKRESHGLNIVLWSYAYPQKVADEALIKLGTSPLGKARLTILKSKISLAERNIEGKNYDKIDWIKFRLDITAPAARARK